MVATAVDRALETVQHQDVELASMVIADDDRLDGRYLEVHQGILSLLALQAPVAGDLRLVAALLHVIQHVERMGDQCVNIAKLVPLAGHEPPSDPEILTARSSDGRARPLPGRPVQAGLRTQGRRTRPGPGPPGRPGRPPEQGGLHPARSSFGDDPDRREWAMYMMLVGRALERIGDNAVDIGEQTAFVVTGPLPGVRGRLAPRADWLAADAARAAPGGSQTPELSTTSSGTPGRTSATATATLPELHRGLARGPRG